MQVARSAQFHACRVSAISVGDKVKSFVISSSRGLSVHDMLSHVELSQVPGEIKFNYFDAEGNMQAVAVDDLTKGKKVQPYMCIHKQCSVSFAVICSHDDVDTCKLQSETYLLKGPLFLKGGPYWSTWSFHPNLQLETLAWLLGESR